jgi:hypothetical protein
MFPNEMVLDPLQKLKIKYELSYQSTTKLKYIVYQLYPVKRFKGIEPVSLVIFFKVFFLH